MCSNHPDLRGSEAAARFVKIQEAYEVVTGKRRGATSEVAPRSSTAAAGWDFHDWSVAEFMQQSAKHHAHLQNGHPMICGACSILEISKGVLQACWHVSLARRKGS